MPVKINGTTSGSVTLAAPDTGSDVTLTLPTTALATEAYVNALVPDSSWSTWTPTWTNLTVGNGTVKAYYTQIGNLVNGVVEFVLGSTSSIGTDPTFSFPVTSATTQYRATITPIGHLIMRDVGVTTYSGVTLWNSSTTALISRNSVSGSNVLISQITSTAPFTWGSGDYFSLTFIYEAA